jgi:hypothetical protein
MVTIWLCAKLACYHLLTWHSYPHQMGALIVGDFFVNFLKELLLSGCGKNQGVFATNKKLTPNPILPNLSFQDKNIYTILLPNPPFFFCFSQTQHRWFFFFPWFFSFLFFFFSLTPHARFFPLFFLSLSFFFSSSSSPSLLTHASSPGFFLLLLPHLSGDG